MPRSTVTLTPGLDGLLKTAPVVAGCHQAAEQMASAARASAPVATGAYRDGIKVVDEIHGDRAASKVYASAPHSMAVEANTGNLSRSQDAGRV